MLRRGGVASVATVLSQACGLHCKALSPQSRHNQGKLMDLKETRGDSALKVGAD